MKATISQKKERETIRMKNIGVLILAVLSLAFMCGYADALTGACSTCHTMHNTQGADSDISNSGPQERLLTSTCVGCHTGSGQKNGDAPVVLQTVDPVTQGNGKTNAGGDFFWVAQGAGSDAKGHNVEGVANADSTLTGNPPGWNQAVTTGLTFTDNGTLKTNEVTGGNGTAWIGQRLTCAGTFGCHGTRDQANFGGISGAHHNNSTSEVVSGTPVSVAKSYRFLANIKGLENTDWNWNETASTHNEYSGENNTNDRSATTTYAGGKDTISFFCAECHGTFHGVIDSNASSGSPWVRHPTDITLPGSGEYATYNPDNTNQYSLSVPVARGNAAIPASSSATVTTGNTGATGAIVMCLSCHRAHGSPENDLLRFTYNMQVGTGAADTGCFVCHTAKNAD